MRFSGRCITDRHDAPQRPMPFYPLSDEEHRSLDAFCGPDTIEGEETPDDLLTNCAAEGMAATTVRES